MRLALLIVALLALAAPAWPQGVSPCTPSSATHQRWGMKTRPAPAGGLEDAQAVTIRQIVRWAVPRGKNLKDEPIVERERTIVTVRGFVRLVKISRDDCDIHIQLSTDASGHHPRSSRRSRPTRPRSACAYRRCSGSASRSRRSTSMVTARRRSPSPVTPSSTRHTGLRRTRRLDTATAAALPRCGKYTHCSTSGDPR